MENGRGETGIYSGQCFEQRGKMLHITRTAGRDNRNINNTADRIEHFEIKATLDAVGIDGIENHLTCSVINAAFDPRNGFHTGIFTTALGEHTEYTVHTLDIGGNDNTLVTVALCRFINQIRIADRTGIDGYLVSTAFEYAVKVFYGIDPSADREWNKDRSRNLTEDIGEQRAADTFLSAETEFEAPKGILRPMALEPIRMRETYSPIAMTEPVRGTFIVDFGQNLAGVARMLLPARMKRGSVITVRFAEELTEDGFLFTAPLRDAKQTDTYIASGDDRDLTVWQPKFTYHGFRYAEIKGIPLFDRHNILAIAEYNDIKNESFFRSGSATVNAIQELVIKTEKSNMHSILTDCPQRNERMAWMNDATVRFEETPYNFDIGRMFPKIIRDIMDTQNEKGQFCCCSPRISFGAVPADPVCSSFLVAGMQAYLHTGNKEILAMAYDSFAAWEDSLLENSTDYIVNYSYYGDWASPEYACIAKENAYSGVTDGHLMSTGYSYFNCKTLVKMAEILGRSADAEKYAKISEKVQRAFLAKWWHPETGIVDRGSQASQAFALWLGILPEDGRQAAADVMRTDLVARNYQITTGNLCTRYLMDMLTTYGYLEDAWTLITKETYPSFGYMLQNEATTVWERLELKRDPGMNSHNHPMYGSIGYWFYAYLCGIRPVSGGYEKIIIRPYYPEKLLSAQCALDTVKGQIAVRWSKRYGKTQLSVAVPFGISAEITVGDDLVSVGSGTHNFEF